MRRTSLNDSWTVRQKTNRFAERMGLGAEPEEVTLPHDALITADRSASGSPASAYFPSGTWEYRRKLELRPEDAGACVALEFEGVYRDALIFVNESVAAHHTGGYSGFVVPIDHLLRPGESNDIRVEARAHEDSRWYSGAGIYRSVWLLQAGRVHLEPNGVQVATAELDDAVAVVSVVASVSNHSTKTSQPVVRVEIQDAQGEVASQCEAPVTAFPGETVVVRQRVCVGDPHRWGPDHPYLYTCRVSLVSEDEVQDAETTTFGIRSLSADPTRGLRINDEPVLLRGACVHHDNGPLGAATIDRAEERRVELLKAAGFNAIRSAHNPLSQPMLDACDRLGMLVMDETFDMWTVPKSEHDYALRFFEAWEDDVEAMVRKDFNHPSVILYSIGNEIPEAGRPDGVHVGRALAEKIRSLDGSRLVTGAISGLLIGGPELFEELRREIAEATTDEKTGVNTALTNLAGLMNELMLSPIVATNSAEALSYLDVAGYNYMESRYEVDRALFPNRVIVGSETHPGAIHTGWAEVKKHPHVIGDFTWTGWDYLGEVGVGRTVYGEASGPSSFMGDYPWLTAWCGDFDITGERRPQSYFREIVYGLRTDPYVAVRRPQHQGEVAGSTPWSWSDAVSSWSWDGFEGKPVTIEVYADADEVELLLNGQSLGRQPAGAEHRYTAVFETVFEPGSLQAVAWHAGQERGRMGLRSAVGPLQLDASADRNVIAAHSGDLAFVALALTDPEGVPYVTMDQKVHVDIEGPGVLQALGSANPESQEGFGGPACTTFDGRALAVVRSQGEGRIAVTATVGGCAPQCVLIEARG
jgi:beta-galactosidase